MDTTATMAPGVVATDDTVHLVERAELTVKITPDDAVIHTHVDNGLVREEHWKSESYLGSGGAGLVFQEKCIMGQSFGQLRVVKEIPKSRNKDDANLDIKTELRGLVILSQPMYEAHFVKTLGWYQTQSKVFVAMEYLPQGHLHAYLLEQGPLPERQAKLVVRQILRGLAYIHEKNLAHRGLKPANIMIRTQPPSNEWWVKIADFGISRRFKKTSSISSAEGLIWGFTAPELLGLSPIGEGLSSEAVAQKGDIWSVGEILHYTLTCAYSFGEDRDSLRQYARDVLSFPTEKLQGQGVSPSCTAFVQELMCSRPILRPNPEQALDHIWARMPNHYTASFSRLCCLMRCRGLVPPSVIFSRDGKRVLAVSPEKLYLIESTTGNLLQTYEAADRTFAAAAISPDDKFAMVLEDSGRLSRFNALTLKPIEERGPFGKMPPGDCFVTYSHDGYCVATAHTCNFVVWRLKGHALPTSGIWRTGNFTVRSMQFTEDDKRITLALDKAVHIIPINTGFNGHGYGRGEETIKYPVTGLISAISPSGVDFVHCDENHIYFWRDNARCWRRQYYHSVPFQSVCFSSSGATVATVDIRGGVALWRARSMSEVGCLKFPEELVSRVAVSPPLGRFIAMGLNDPEGPKVIVVREIISFVP